MVKLKNVSKRALVFNLEHPTFVNAPGLNGVGQPESVTFLAGETKELHEDALKCREVAAALQPGDPRTKATLRRI